MSNLVFFCLPHFNSLFNMFEEFIEDNISPSSFPPLRSPPPGPTAAAAAQGGADGVSPPGPSHTTSICPAKMWHTRSSMIFASSLCISVVWGFSNHWCSLGPYLCDTERNKKTNASSAILKKTTALRVMRNAHALSSAVLLKRILEFRSRTISGHIPTRLCVRDFTHANASLLWLARSVLCVL